MPENQTRPGRLVVDLADHAMRRLLILSEESNVQTVLNDAVMLLWEYYYPSVLTDIAESNELNPIIHNTLSISNASDPDKCKKAQMLHAQGMYVEDIAAELDWSLESVQLALNQAESATPAEASGTTLEPLQAQVKKLRGEGMSLSAIAQKLNQNSVPTVSGSGKWHHGAIKRLLR